MSVCACVPGVPCEVHPAMTTPDAEPTTREERRFWHQMAEDVATWRLSGDNALRLIADVERLEAENKRLQGELLTLANECHATLEGWAKETLGWDAAILCRRHMGLPEPLSEYLEQRHD